MPITNVGGDAPVMGQMGSAEPKGQVDTYLKLEGIEGEAPGDGHTNEIQIDGWELGGSNAGSAALSKGTGAGKVQVHDVVVTMNVDKAAPKIFEAMATGKPINTAVITVQKSGGDPLRYLTVTLTKVLVSSFHTTGNALLPRIKVTLNFGKIEMEYKTQNDNGTGGGTVKAGFDLVKGHKV